MYVLTYHIDECEFKIVYLIINIDMKMPISVAGFFGYMAGKLSYMKTCQEKFKRLENSPLGEALRQRTGLPSQR